MSTKILKGCRKILTNLFLAGSLLVNNIFNVGAINTINNTDSPTPEACEITINPM